MNVNKLVSTNYSDTQYPMAWNFTYLSFYTTNKTLVNGNSILHAHVRFYFKTVLIVQPKTCHTRLWKVYSTRSTTNNLKRRRGEGLHHCCSTIHPKTTLRYDIGTVLHISMTKADTSKQDANISLVSLWKLAVTCQLNIYIIVSNQKTKTKPLFYSKTHTFPKKYHENNRYRIHNLRNQVRIIKKRSFPFVTVLI